MKVYLATKGEYSAYQIVHVFARREDADAYELADNVEEYELQQGPVEVRTEHTITWSSWLPTREGTERELPNPHETSQPADFDGHPNRVTYRWDDLKVGRELVVTGWDLAGVRKVLSEQIASHAIS